LQRAGNNKLVQTQKSPAIERILGPGSFACLGVAG